MPIFNTAGSRRLVDVSRSQDEPFFRRDEIRGVLFDANGVIYHRPRPNRRLNQYLAPHGLGVLGVRETREMIAAEREAARTGQLSNEDYFRAKLRAYGLTDPALVDDAVRLMAEDSADIALFPGTREGLEELKEAGLALAIVTDSAKPARVKLGWFESKGISHELFDAVVSSAEAGCCKPEPRIYLEALERLGIAPHEAAFVGHATDELEGAAAIGMKTIAFRADDPNVEATVHVDDLRDFADMIG